MTTRTVEIEDTLRERTDGAIEEVKDAVTEWLDANPDADKAPCWSNDLDYSGRMSEIIDGSVPVYCSEIEATWYLHSDLLESAYDDAGIGNNMRENSGMVAIYCYIEQKASEWYYENKDALFNTWKEEHSEVKCDDCEWMGAEDDCDEIRKLSMRVGAGDPTPSGQCPECEALCFPIVKK